MKATPTPSPPGNREAAPWKESGQVCEATESIPLPGTLSSQPLAIVRQYAATLNGLSLPDFMRERILAAIIKAEAVALAIEMLAEAENGGLL